MYIVYDQGMFIPMQKKEDVIKMVAAAPRHILQQMAVSERVNPISFIPAATFLVKQKESLSAEDFNASGELMLEYAVTSWHKKDYLTKRAVFNNGLYRIEVTVLRCDDSRRPHFIATIRPVAQNKFQPAIYCDWDTPDTRAELRLETVSFGALPLEEYDRFMTAQMLARRSLEILQHEFFRVIDDLDNDGLKAIGLYPLAEDAEEE